MRKRALPQLKVGRLRISIKVMIYQLKIEYINYNSKISIKNEKYQPRLVKIPAPLSERGAGISFCL